MRTGDLPPFLFPSGLFIFLIFFVIIIIIIIFILILILFTFVGKTRFMNDLEAACFGLIKLNSEGHIEDYFSSLQEGRGDRYLFFFLFFLFLFLSLSLFYFS